MQKSTEQKRSKQDLIGLCCGQNVNWAQQMSQLNKLLKNYTYEEVEYAINYYKKQGIELTSIGYFVYSGFKNMKVPVSLLQAEKQIAEMNGGGNSSDRNKQRVRENNKANSREVDYFSMFEI